MKPYAHSQNGTAAATSEAASGGNHAAKSVIKSPDAIFEVDEFISDVAALQNVNTEYFNHLYIYPKMLNYDNQKIFTKVGAILCCLIAEV